MKTFALVGKSGTGKSFRALDVAHMNNIEAVIDDGLLISRSKVLSGKSAKHEGSRMASVKCAIFEDSSHALSVRDAIHDNGIDSILILGTSDEMVQKIAERLDLLPIDQTFYIEDVSSPEEIEIANTMRNKQGKHIIPVPALEVKKHFSGYFLRALLPQGKRTDDSEKTIMRPTYSYMGKFVIAPKVISDICRFEILKLDGIRDVKIKSTSDSDGCIDLYIELSLIYPCNIPKTSAEIQKSVSQAIEDYTSIIVKSVDIFVKSLDIRGDKND